MKNKEKKEKIKKVMEQLGISELKDKLPKQISGGEKQRTAIARATVKDSKYVLADEPTGALDSSNTERLMQVFQELNRAGKTIVIVTHDKEVAEYADRIIYLTDGRITEEVNKAKGA